MVVLLQVCSEAARVLMGYIWFEAAFYVSALLNSAMIINCQSCGSD